MQNGELINSTISTKIQELFLAIRDDEQNLGASVKGNVSFGDFARVILNKFNQINHLHSDPVFLEAVYDWVKFVHFN